MHTWPRKAGSLPYASNIDSQAGYLLLGNPSPAQLENGTRPQALGNGTSSRRLYGPWQDPTRLGVTALKNTGSV